VHLPNQKSQGSIIWDAKYMKSNTTFRLTITLSLLALISLSVYGFAFAGWTIGTNTTANVSGTYDSLANGLVAHYTFDGSSVTPTTVADVSGNGNTGTIVGDAHPDEGKIGQGFYFDGNNDYISVAHNTSLNMLDEMSVSIWVKIEQTGLSQTKIFERSSGRSFFVHWKSDNTFGFSTSTNGGTSYNNNVFSNYLISSFPSPWIHIVAVFDGTHNKLYINGVLDNSISFSQGTLNDLGGGFNISSSIFDYLGSFDDARIYNRALSADEITRLYNMGSSKLGVTPTDSLDAGLVGHWDFDGKNVTSTTVADTSGNGNTGTIAGGAHPDEGKIGQGMSFDGATSTSVNVPHSSSLLFNTVTVSVWVKGTTQSPSSWGEIVYKRVSSSTPGFWIGVSSTGPSLQLGVNTSALANQSKIMSNVLNGGWRHVVMVLKSDGTWLGYLDNVLSVNSTYSVGSGIQNTETLKIGGAYADGFEGKIDDVRIYNRALSADEITRLYNMGSSKLGVTPTDSLDSGLVGHWDFDGKNVTSTTVADTSGNGNTGTIYGDAKPDEGKIGQGFYFDGNGDYINVGNNSSLNAQTITVSAWVKWNGSDGLMVGDSASNTPYGYLLVVTSSGRPSLSAGGGWNKIYPTTPLAQNTWTHIVFSVDESSLAKMYVNAAQVGSATISPMSLSGQTTLIGKRQSNESYLTGSLDDVRIYNRALTQSEITRLYNMGR
jgi:hypothetical protein